MSSKYNTGVPIDLDSLDESELAQAFYEWAEGSQALEDLRTIKQAVISYQGLSKVTPSSITMEDLQEGLSATESLDGTTHEALLKEAKTDPWGGEYVITIDASGAGTISTSAAVSGGGLDNEITIDF